MAESNTINTSNNKYCDVNANTPTADLTISAINNAPPVSDDTRTTNDSISLINDIYSDSEDDCDKKAMLRKWYSHEDVSYFLILQSKFYFKFIYIFAWFIWGST